ncbi:hypothetical protein D9756_009672 [Leucocoprinus leucothites]|uniref:Possible tRNA binding domain-containing protein n=1 Tax=Leucocoprinus leucothites TaxID=201217 RepID=A0A8H5CWE0_9AGAR|nr:hypothetical protein D9756_009672 [Leucoagaricus leucothites]
MRGEWKSVSAALEDELNEAGDEAAQVLKEKQREMIDALDLRKYAINDRTADWSAQITATRAGAGAGRSTVVSVKVWGEGSKKRKADTGEAGPTDAGTGESRKNRRTRVWRESRSQPSNGKAASDTPDSIARWNTGLDEDEAYLRKHLTSKKAAAT